MALNKLVVKFQNGEIVKGWTTDFKADKDYFYLRPLEEYGKKPIEIAMPSLKAVFFVKDFIGNKDYKKVRTFNVDLKISQSQRELIIFFKDRENLYVISRIYGKYKLGFFVILDKSIPFSFYFNLLYLSLLPN